MDFTETRLLKSKSLLFLMYTAETRLLKGKLFLWILRKRDCSTANCFYGFYGNATAQRQIAFIFMDTPYSFHLGIPKELRNLVLRSSEILSQGVPTPCPKEFRNLVPRTSEILSQGRPKSCPNDVQSFPPEYLDCP